ncbi:hypothetical protein LCGC14_2462300 [marine sediment metagenome]|uniref:Uncharacterized protein n=1 Tax=marine sediment metagenome TaxID=412755 RepID=A0A0F9C0M2_9ZZZZ
MFRGGRFSPRFSGAGRQVLKQVLSKNMIRVIMTPLLKKKIREEFGCTDADIEKGIAKGITEFGEDFKKMMAEQRAILTLPKDICKVCGDAGVVDSGGQNPDGSWIDIPCPYCTKSKGKDNE